MGDRIAFLLLAALLAAGLSGSLSAQQTNLGLSNYEHFVLQYTNDKGTVVQVDESASFLPKYYFQWGGFLVTLWQIKIPGTAPVRAVWVGAFHNPYSREFFMAVFHPQGMPPGWRVDYIEQEYLVKPTGVKSVKALRFAHPKVYGPTFYSAATAQRQLHPYPGYLQTQQVTLEDDELGGAMTMYTTDDNGLRKELGFETDGTLENIKFLARFVPDQGTKDPLPILWMANYRVKFEYGLEGFEQAIDFYRKQQLQRASSFLSSRQPASKTIHPYMRDSKFAVGVGATLSTVQLSNGQFDVSQPYRQSVLSYFSSLHGHDMQLYHLGWYLEAPNQPLVVPDNFETITPGHKSFIWEALWQFRNIRSVGYSLPAVLHPESHYYSPGVARISKDGSLSTFTVPAWPGAVYRDGCYYPQAATSIYTSIYYNHLFSRHRFSGAYMDALSPVHHCFGHHEHKHPAGRNEQLIGINRMLDSIRGKWTTRSRIPPVLYNETPMDCMRTDGSALDINTWDPNYWNLFRMTYTGEEWPTWGVVWGWDILGNKPSGYEYARELANCLAGGSRPMILWPEIHNVMPLNPGADKEYAVFEQMLASYVKNWDSVWKKIIFGRRFQPLDPNDLLSTTIKTVQPLWTSGDPVTDQWRLPGYEPKASGKGCNPSRLRGNSSAAVMSGLFEPCDKQGCRWLVLYRWTDPVFGTRMRLPSTHPLHNKTETVRMALSARSLRSRPGALVKLLDPVTQRSITLGRLPTSATQKTSLLSAQLERYGLKIVVIE